MKMSKENSINIITNKQKHSILFEFLLSLHHWKVDCQCNYRLFVYGGELMSQQKCILWRTEILKSDSWKDEEKAGEYTSDFGPQQVFKSFPLIIAMHFQPSKNKFLLKKV